MSNAHGEKERKKENEMLYIVQVLSDDGRLDIKYFKTLEAAQRHVELVNKYYNGDGLSKKFASLKTVEFEEDFSARMKAEKKAKGEKTFSEMTSEEKQEYLKSRKKEMEGNK